MIRRWVNYVKKNLGNLEILLKFKLQRFPNAMLSITKFKLQSELPKSLPPSDLINCSQPFSRFKAQLTAQFLSTHNSPRYDLDFILIKSTSISHFFRSPHRCRHSFSDALQVFCFCEWGEKHVMDHKRFTEI